MPKVTWLGVPGEDTETNVSGGITFEKGKAVETDNPGLLEMAAGNQYFKVEGYEVPPDKPPVEIVGDVWPAPSSVSPQHPVPKPGEPIPPSTPEAPAPKTEEHTIEAASAPKPIQAKAAVTSVSHKPKSKG